MQNDGGVVISGSPSGGNFDATNLSPVGQFFHNKWVRTVLVLDVIAIIAVVAVLIFNNTKTATINLNVTPVDASIQIGATGGGYTNGSYQIHPGTYDITISHDGLESKTFTLDLQSGYNATLTTFLKGEGDNFDFYTLKDNFNSFQELASIASGPNNQTTDRDTSAETFISDFQKNYSLYNSSLPLTYNDTSATTAADGSLWYSTVRAFDIVANDDDECQRTICLDAAMRIGNDQNFIEKFLEEKGFNLNFCEVIYEVPYPEF